MSTEERSVATEEKVVYVQEKPFLRLLKYTAVTIAVAVVVLFIFGFIVGLTGSRVPSIDSGVIGDQWDRLTSGERGDSTWNELEKLE